METFHYLFKAHFKYNILAVLAVGEIVSLKMAVKYHFCPFIVTQHLSQQ